MSGLSLGHALNISENTLPNWQQPPDMLPV
jgi:hypothetical protein